MDVDETKNGEVNTKANTSGLAIAALVLGIIGLVFSFIPIINNIAFIIGGIGLILGIVGLILSKKKAIGVVSIILCVLC